MLATILDRSRFWTVTLATPLILHSLLLPDHAAEDLLRPTSGDTKQGPIWGCQKPFTMIILSGGSESAGKSAIVLEVLPTG